MTAAIRVPMVLALLLLAEDARAGDMVKARALAEEGQAAFAIGNYAVAAERFAASYAESKSPGLLWNIASSLRKQFNIDHNLAHLRRAQEVYANFASLTNDPKEKADALSEAATIDGILRAVESAGATQAPPVAATPVAAVPVAATPVAATPVAATPVAATPVAATPVAAPPTAVAPVAAPPIATPPTVPAATPIYKRWWLWTAVAVVVGAGVGVGVAFAVPNNVTLPGDLNGGRHSISF